MCDIINKIALEFTMHCIKNNTNAELQQNTTAGFFKLNFHCSTYHVEAWYVLQQFCPTICHRNDEKHQQFFHLLSTHHSSLHQL